MVPGVKLYLVGSAIKGKENPNDLDIVGIMSKEDFKFRYDFTREEYTAAHKVKPPPKKLLRYRHECRVVEWALSALFGYKIDFKWLPESMLYEPNVEISLTPEAIVP